MGRLSLERHTWRALGRRNVSACGYVRSIPWASPSKESQLEDARIENILTSQCMFNSSLATEGEQSHEDAK
jgi:hypothetical protein